MGWRWGMRWIAPTLSRAAAPSASSLWPRTARPRPTCYTSTSSRRRPYPRLVRDRQPTRTLTTQPSPPHPHYSPLTTHHSPLNLHPPRHPQPSPSQLNVQPNRRRPSPRRPRRCCRCCRQRTASSSDTTPRPSTTRSKRSRTSTGAGTPPPPPRPCSRAERRAAPCNGRRRRQVGAAVANGSRSGHPRQCCVA